MVRLVTPLARRLPMRLRWLWTSRLMMTKAVKAAAPRNRIGNMSAISPKPAISSWSAALDGCSARVVIEVAPAPRARVSRRSSTAARSAPGDTVASASRPWPPARSCKGACGANTTPKSCGSVSTSWRLRAGHRYSGEDATPSTGSSVQPNSVRTCSESPGPRP